MKVSLRFLSIAFLLYGINVKQLDIFVIKSHKANISNYFQDVKLFNRRVRPKQSKTKQNKVKQSKVKQSKVKQNKVKQNIDFQANLFWLAL